MYQMNVNGDVIQKGGREKQQFSQLNTACLFNAASQLLGRHISISPAHTVHVICFASILYTTLASICYGLLEQNYRNLLVNTV